MKNFITPLQFDVRRLEGCQPGLGPQLTAPQRCTCTGAGCTHRQAMPLLPASARRSPLQAVKLLSFGNHVLMTVYLVLAAVAATRIYVAFRPQLPPVARMHYRDCIAGLLHPCAFFRQAAGPAHLQPRASHPASLHHSSVFCGGIVIRLA